MPEATRLVTADELEKFPDDDFRYELVEGRVVRMSPVGFRHGTTVIRLGALLMRHAQERGLGAVMTEVGFKLASNPDTVRAPDVAFVRQDRIPTPEPRGFWNGPPDLAVEVLSPDDRTEDIRAKVAEYLTQAVPTVVVVDPDSRKVTVLRPATPELALATDDVLDLSDVVSGFRCTVRELFE
ncbi:MAG TPA: Uma2 family endonuclease [Vicinamibacterales bacterium]|jgi:Uma2 family endonuclease|nr:Uma2 family endonuclease [Vicinamibacterales bacterium]